MRVRKAFGPLLLLGSTSCLQPTEQSGSASSTVGSRAPRYATAPTTYFPPPEAAGGWRRLVPPNTVATIEQRARVRNTVGLDWSKLRQAWDASAKYGGTFLVIRKGWIAGEWGATGPLLMASCTKTLTSLAVHRMFEMSARGTLRRSISPDSFAYRYLPVSWGSHATRRTIRLRHLLSMSSGLQPDDSPPAPDQSTETYRRKLLDPAVRTAPGKEWIYSSLSADLQSLVLQNATGVGLGDFFQRHVGGPVGVRSLRWASLGEHTYASAYARISGRDLARIAYLLRHRGRWGSSSIVSGQRVDSLVNWATELRATTYGSQIKFPTDPNSHRRYGRLVWTNRTRSPYVGESVPEDAYYCAGFGTRFAMVVPSLDLIIVRLQNGPTPWSDAVFTAITNRVMGAIVTPTASASGTH